jgi:hypothetical protein
MRSKSQYPYTTSHFALQCHLATQFNGYVQPYENMAEMFTNHLLYFPKMNPHHFALRLVAVRLFDHLEKFLCRK